MIKTHNSKKLTKLILLTFSSSLCIANLFDNSNYNISI